MVVVPGQREASDPEPRNSGSRFARAGMTASPSIIDPDRPDLDRSISGAGNARGDGQRFVEILGLDQIVAAELFARFRERSIRRQRLAVAASILAYSASFW